MGAFEPSRLYIQMQQVSSGLAEIPATLRLQNVDGRFRTTCSIELSFTHSLQVGGDHFRYLFPCQPDEASLFSAKVQASSEMEETVPGGEKQQELGRFTNEGQVSRLAMMATGSGAPSDSPKVRSERVDRR